MANSLDTVTRLNHLAQTARITAGDLDPAGPRLQVGQHRMLVGDEVVTRRNHRRLHTDLGFMVKNRDHWTLTGIHHDGSITLTGLTGTVRIPRAYAAEHMELGYAQTGHASQGRTVDLALLLIDRPTDSRGVYTPMTRGREANHAYVVVEDNETAFDVITEAIAREWVDQPALARKAELNTHLLRQLAPNCPGDEDEVGKLVQRARRLMAERRARSRHVERTMGRGP
jgi:ATP-dependent exoDNAse (exonuclease V) alpha subunit